MTKQLIIRNIMLGIFSWLIPFAVSFLFYNNNGQLNVPYANFKSVMLVTGTISGCFLLYMYFKFVSDSFIKNGIIVGVSWFVINIIMDVAVLIPMMKSTFAVYFMSIGFGYVAIPIISVTIGYILDKKIKHNK